MGIPLHALHAFCGIPDRAGGIYCQTVRILAPGWRGAQTNNLGTHVSRAGAVWRPGTMRRTNRPATGAVRRYSLLGVHGPRRSRTARSTAFDGALRHQSDAAVSWSINSAGVNLEAIVPAFEINMSPYKIQTEYSKKFHARSTSP